MNDSTILGMDLGLFISEVGIIVTTLSAAVGIWIERDRTKPVRTPIALTTMVLGVAFISMYQAWSNDLQQQQLEEDLAKVLTQLDEVASKSEVEVPDLNETIKNEMMIHGRANPRVLMEMARRVAAKGGDPMEVLAAYLPEADLQAMKRAGGFEGIPLTPSSPTKRPKLTFGSGAPRLRTEAPGAGEEHAGAATGDNALDGGAPEGGAEPAPGSTDTAGDAGTDAGTDAGADAGGSAREEEERLNVQIAEARRELAEAKTDAEKQERKTKLFALLGEAEKLAKKNGARSPAPTPSSTTSTKKPTIEIDEDEK